jgi:hypothetical protein
VTSDINVFLLHLIGGLETSKQDSIYLSNLVFLGQLD